MKQCLNVFYLNRRSTTILEEKLYTISWFPSWTVSLFQRWFSKTRWPFHQFLSRECWLHSNSGSNLLWVKDIVIGFLRKIKYKQIINTGQNTGKNNGFPILDIFGYLKNTHKNPKFRRVRQIPIGRSEIHQGTGAS